MSMALLVAPDGPAVALCGPPAGPRREPSPPDADGSARSAHQRRAFHAALAGYRPTPLRRATHAAERLGVGEVLVKDESARLGLPSFKVLGASWAVHRALVEHLGSTPDEIPTLADLRRALPRAEAPALAAATDGNHGRAVARMAASLGLRARIFVPSDMVRARIAAIEGEGASVTVVDGGYDEAVARSAREAGPDCLVISDTSWPGYERVPAWVIEGYGTIFDEIEEELGREHRPQPDVVVVPIGVGALAAAVVAHYRSRQGGGPRLVGVEPTSAACVLESVAAGEIVTLPHPQTSVMAGLNCATPSLIAWPLVSRLDVYVAVPDAVIPQATRLLARDGIVAGECGAAGLAAMMALVDDQRLAQQRECLALGTGSRVLLLCTEGATDPEAHRRMLEG
ncbi:MAG TPA: diaminopropionate ammonia-lyase [Solirubrobacteraceae bacterium]|nr:diaminopropionate ammonia-lyase [Solirubrobacteraceae bacterium]